MKKISVFFFSNYIAAVKVEHDFLKAASVLDNYNGSNTQSSLED